jgi:hypothetical protein
VLDAASLIIQSQEIDFSNSLPRKHSVSDVKDPVELIVKLAPAAAAPGSAGHLAVQACITQVGVSIKPLHQSTSESELATYFIAHVDAAKIENVVKQLLACEGIEGAYAKPRGEPPQ